MANQAIVFGLAGIGGLILTSAVTGASLGDVVQGHPGTVQKTSLLGSLSTGAVTGTGAAVGTAATATAAAATTAVSGLVSGKGVPVLPYGTPLTGSAATTWATSILAGIGAPTTQANLASMENWFAHEGGGGQNNPLNTTLETSGVTGTINQDGVRSYGTPTDGVAATVQTLQNGYPSITAALQSGVGLSAGSPGVSGELSKWSGGGYSSL